MSHIEDEQSHAGSFSSGSPYVSQPPYPASQVSGSPKQYGFPESSSNGRDGGSGGESAAVEWVAEGHGDLELEEHERAEELDPFGDAPEVFDSSVLLLLPSLPTTAPRTRGKAVGCNTLLVPSSRCLRSALRMRGFRLRSRASAQMHFCARKSAAKLPEWSSDGQAANGTAAWRVSIVRRVAGFGVLSTCFLQSAAAAFHGAGDAACAFHRPACFPSSGVLSIGVLSIGVGRVAAVYTGPGTVRVSASRPCRPTKRPLGLRTRLARARSLGR